MNKKFSILIIILIFFNIFSFSNNNFLTKDIPRTNPGYKALDWFIIQNKTPDILSYSRDKTLSAYRFTMLTVEIIQKINDFDKKIPSDILEILEDLLPQLSNEIRFLYGDILTELRENLKIHRQKTGRIERTTKPIKRKKIGIYSNPSTVFNAQDSRLKTSYTYMFQKESWEKLISKEEYNNLTLFFLSDLTLRKTPIKTSILFNDLFSQLNTNVKLKNTSKRINTLTYQRYEDELNGTDSYSLLKSRSSYFLKTNDFDFNFTMINSKKKNDDSKNYFFTGFKSNEYSVDIIDINNDDLDSKIYLSHKIKNIETLVKEKEKTTIAKFFLNKTIYGKLFNGLNINNSTTLKTIDTGNANTYSGKLTKNCFKLILPITISDYILNITNSKYSADNENILDYSYKENRIDLIRYWYDLSFLDIQLQFSHQEFTPSSSAPVVSKKNDFIKKYFTLSTTRYFNNNSNLNINITTGEKSFWKQDLIHSNFRFFQREIGFYIKDYVISYSALDKRFDLPGIDPKQLHYDIGVYYAKNW